MLFYYLGSGLCLPPFSVGDESRTQTQLHSHPLQMSVDNGNTQSPLYSFHLHPSGYSWLFDISDIAKKKVSPENSHFKFPGGTSGKDSACQCRRCKRSGLDLWVGKTPWRRKWQPTPLFLPGKVHGQRNLVGCSPWGHKESDTTEHTHTHTEVP